MQHIVKACLLGCVTLLFFGAQAVAQPLSREAHALLQRMEMTLQRAKASPLQGAWVGRQGPRDLILIFQHNVCAMGVDGQEVYGLWRTNGPNLSISWATGKQTNFRYQLNADTLTLDGTTHLTRYRMHTGATFGSASNQAPIPGFGPKQSPLEGHWVRDTPQGRDEFYFQGGQYHFVQNGQEIERGRFDYVNGQIRYAITSGAGVGRSGTFQARMVGQELQLMAPGGTLRFFRAPY